MSESAILGMVFGLGVAIVLIRIAAIERRLHRLSRLDAKIDALLNHAGIRFDEFWDVPPEVREALERGETILALKRFREATGAGLRESKEFIDEIRRRKAPPGSAMSARSAGGNPAIPRRDPSSTEVSVRRQHRGMNG